MNESVNYGTLVVAIIALIQPWVLALWKRYFRQGKIEIYQTGNIEVGYSTFGPTIGLNGTLRCINRDLFVQTIQLELIKQKDSSQHVFEWGLFRSEKMTSSGEQQATFELPYGFMLSTSLPRRFNIQFHDIRVQSEMRQITNKISEEWWANVRELPWSKGKQTTLESQDPFLVPYEGFKKSNTYVQAYTSLDRMCYWEAGKYTLKIIVRTSKPDRSFEKKWDFTLNTEEVQTIPLNVVKLLEDTCARHSPYPYYFVFPKYEAE